METIKTLEQFASLINESDEFEISFWDIMKMNGWKDNSDKIYGICESDDEVLEFDESATAVVRKKYVL